MRRFLRKQLHKYGLIDRARRIKRQFNSTENEFKAADPRTLISTMLCIDRSIELNGHILGDYLEFGIFRGFNLWIAQAFARMRGVRGMRSFGFDSFIGIPPVTGVDKGGAFKEGDFSAYRDEVESWLTRYGVNWDETFLIPGFFDNSLHSQVYIQYQLKHCSLCVVDCDLYSSTVPVLEFVRPLLQVGSIIYFDDWDDFDSGSDKGEPLAFKQFQDRVRGEVKFEEVEDLIAVGGKGKAYVVV